MSPEKKKEQREQALAKANKTRLERAEIKRSIKMGLSQASAIALNPIDSTRRMTLLELITSRDRWGKKRATRLLNGIGLGAGKTLESLTDRQRRLLVDALRRTEN